MAGGSSGQAPQPVCDAASRHQDHHSSHERQGHSEISHGNRTPIQRGYHEAHRDYFGESENQINHTKLSFLPAADIHREPSLGGEGGKKLPPRHQGSQEPSDGAVGRRTTHTTTAARYSATEGREVCRKANFLWEMPGVGPQGVGVRQEGEVRLLFSESRHKSLQGEIDKWRDNSVEMPQLLPGTPRMEPQVSPETHHQPTTRCDTGHDCPATLPHRRRLPTPTPLGTPAVRSPAYLTSDPPSPLLSDAAATTTTTTPQDAATTTPHDTTTTTTTNTPHDAITTTPHDAATTTTITPHDATTTTRHDTATTITPHHATTTTPHDTATTTTPHHATTTTPPGALTTTPSHPIEPPSSSSSTPDTGSSQPSPCPSTTTREASTNTKPCLSSPKQIGGGSEDPPTGNKTTTGFAGSSTEGKPGTSAANGNLYEEYGNGIDKLENDDDRSTSKYHRNKTETATTQRAEWHGRGHCSHHAQNCIPVSNTDSATTQGTSSEREAERGGDGHLRTDRSSNRRPDPAHSAAQTPPDIQAPRITQEQGDSTINQLTFLQWNIHGLVSKATSLLQYINTHNTAVILLQESLVTDASTIRLSRRYQVFCQPYQLGGSRGLITMVRKDIPATLTDNPHDLGEQVDTLCITLHLGGIYKFNVYNVYCRQRSHLDLLPLLEDVNTKPTLLSGDFNAHHPHLEPWGSGITNQRGRHITHVLDDFPAAVLQGEPRPTHVAGGRLDLTIIVNGDTQDMNMKGVPELLSDHWAQEMSLSVNIQTDSSHTKKKWLTHKADWRVFTNILNTWYADYQVPESVQQFAIDLTKAIQDAADASIPTRGKKKYNPKKKYCWYYDDRVKLLTRMTRQLTKTYQSTKNEEDRTNLLEWNTYARQEMDRIREGKWLASMANLDHTTNMSAVWKKINTVRGKHTRPPAYSDPAGKAEELITEYRDRSTTASLPQQLRDNKDTLDPARLANVTTAVHLHDDTDHCITREELLRARKSSQDTAPGEDGITYSMLNHVCDVIGDPLLRLFNMSLMHGVVPEAWTTANIVPIPKHNDPGKYRPISLTPTICKMMERILLHRLLYKIGKFDTGVNGFVQHRSTANCLANYKSNAKAKTEVFIDIEKAFDRAQPLVILDELTKLGVKGKLLAWIQQYLTNRRARVTFQGQVSQCHTLENGTPQGSVISPTLFNVLMNVLATLPYPAGTQHIGYADDIVLQTTGKDSIDRMQDSLDILANKCDAIGFTISHHKTKAMAKTRHTPHDKLRLQGQDIDWVTTHRYLGVVVTRNGTTKAEVQHLKDKCHTRNRVLKALSWRGMGASSAVILTAYKALVRSLIDYASPALLTMTASDAASLEAVQNEALRAVLGAPKWTKTANLRAETQIPTVIERIKYMTATFTIKTCTRGRPDQVLTDLRQHHQGRRGQGKWIAKAAANIRDFGISWEDVRAATLHHGAHSPPPWTPLPLQATIKRPRNRKQDTVTAELRQQGLQTINETRLPNTAEYYTDGSADPRTGRAGAAFVCVVRNAAETPVPTTTAAATATTTTTSAVRITDFSSSTQAELAAIHMALQHAHTSHSYNVVLHTDSMTAIHCLTTQNTESTQQTHTIHNIAAALQNTGQTVTVNWIPSHVGIVGNERADTMARRSAQEAVVGLHIPPNLRQMLTKMRTHADTRRLQQDREGQRGGSASARWLGAIQASDGTQQAPRGLTRRCEVVRARIRLGHPYKWQVGIATPDSKKQCRLCQQSEGHTLEHYLRDCAKVNTLREQCPVPSPTLTELAVHFINILPQTLSAFPDFCGYDS